MNIEVFKDEQSEQLVTTSLNVAEVFGKNHQHVTRAIRDIIKKWDELGLTNFGQSSYFIKSQYVNEQGKPQPMYLITKKGAARLIMGFTGIEAEKFKVGYIETFDSMEQYILETKEYLIKAHEETVASLRAENKALVERADAVLEATSYFKVRTYFDAQGIKLTTEECKSLGLEATKYCRRKAIPIKTEFTDLGKTNTYPTNVLQLLHKQYISSRFNNLGLFN